MGYAYCEENECGARCGKCCDDSECTGVQLDCAVATCNQGQCNYDYSNCDGNIFELRILTDYYADETTWTLEDSCNGDSLVASGGPYDEGLTEHVHQILLPRHMRYSLTIYDTYGTYKAWIHNNCM